MREAAGVVVPQRRRHVDLAAGLEELLRRQLEAGVGVDGLRVPVLPHGGSPGVTLGLAGQQQLLAVSGLLLVLVHRFVRSWRKRRQGVRKATTEDT